MCGLDLHDRAGDVGVLEAEERQVDRDDHVDVRIGEHRFERLAIVLDRSGGDHVDGIPDGGGGRQEAPELRFRFVRELGHLHALFADGVGAHDAGAAGVRDDGDPVALRNRAVGEDLGGCEEILEGELADDARLAQERVGGEVGACKTARVGGCGGGACGRAARLECEHGLLLGEARGDAAEVCGILDGLHVEKDLPDVFVPLPVFKRGLGVHVGLVADRNELREAEVEVAENVEDAPTERTGLGDEADVAALGQRFGKAGVHAHGGMRVDDAETVRPHAAHAVAADAFEKLGLEPGAFSPRFLEACGDHAQALDALFVALVDRLKHEACVHDDDGKVHFAGNVEHRRIGGQAFDDAALRVDRIDGAGVAVFTQALHDVRADGVLLGGGADDRDRAGLHDLVEDVHKSCQIEGWVRGGLSR